LVENRVFIKNIKKDLLSLENCEKVLFGKINHHRPLKIFQPLLRGGLGVETLPEPHHLPPPANVFSVFDLA